MPTNPLEISIKRISAARELLLAVQNKQSTDGALDFPQDLTEEYGSHLNVLCTNGFIRKCDVPDGGFPYRITWKGLCFLDICTLHEQVANEHAPNSPQGVMVQVAMFSFH